ncbi:MAG: beta-mannosidase [Bacteroidaceae bacterium]|nr:beta-mannosidase [Bacteroidaceae bacterium]
MNNMLTSLTLLTAMLTACGGSGIDEPGAPVTPPAPTISYSLHNPAATAEAKSVFQLLADNYGKKMLTGAMGGVVWETNYTDFVAEQCGAYPAIVGFDFMHLSHSPSDWIDYGDITPVKSAWENGSIPTICWHWRVPTEEPDTPDTRGPVEEDEDEELTFNANETDFNCDKATMPGTWENGVVNADLEKVAGYLKLLQDAGIPVLFRPLHEAAGDFGWGPWFWWGNSGTEATKKLWIYIHDKFTKEYGLNNLIWVWTMQTLDKNQLANASKIATTYPGDDYVDIVGADIYAKDVLGDQTQAFNLIKQAVSGRKMVALCECGNLTDPEIAARNGALWSYFMQWYDIKQGKPGFYNYAGPEQWKKVAASKYVLNRGSLKLK